MTTKTNNALAGTPADLLPLPAYEWHDDDCQNGYSDEQMHAYALANLAAALAARDREIAGLVKKWREEVAHHSEESRSRACLLDYADELAAMLAARPQPAAKENQQ